MKTTEEFIKQKVLFVDDEDSVLDGLKRSLRSMRKNWNMHFAQNADDALAKTAAIQFDAIITDINMPGKDGLELLKNLQASEVTQDIPVVILTGQGDGDLKRKALNLGATDLLNKPFNREDLIARIRSVLNLKAHQDEIKYKNILLENKVNELNKLERMRTDLFNMLIHDLKAPVSVLLGNLEILAHTIIDENIEFVRSAQSGCHILFNMIADLLDISRMEDGILKLDRTLIDPEEISLEAIHRFKGMAISKDIKLMVEISEDDHGQKFYGDYNVILRILQNLITNGIQYSPPNSEVYLKCNYLDDAFIQFSVIDHGPGVPIEFQKEIFNKFFQVEKCKDGRIYTTGLGLTFCKLAVESHKGKIEVKSDGKSGSNFCFTIPTEVSADEDEDDIFKL